MSTTISTPGPPGLPPEPIARITVEQYHAMINADILAEDYPVELLEGWLVPKMAKKRPHSRGTRKLRVTLEKSLPPGWYLESQEPVTTVDSEPEPDISVVRGDPEDYPDRHPGSKDVALIVEVSESTLARDRGMKKRVYARASLPVYWIVNLVDNQIKVYSDPTGPVEQPDYRQMQIYKPGESIPIILDGKVIAKIEVKQLLP
jgi:Uma2 family endonuclease